MRILVTGAYGFIGKNLTVALGEYPHLDIISFGREESDEVLLSHLAEADMVIHLAGENRPDSPDKFEITNVGLTIKIVENLRALERKIPIIFASSVQADFDNPYGKSKKAAEDVLRNLSKVNGNPVAIYRLPGVFGKWCKPNYNSVVATFCYNLANNKPIRIDDPEIIVSLVYIDDVVGEFISKVDSQFFGIIYPEIEPLFKISLGDLAKQIREFKNSRTSLVSERVGEGLARGLHACYLSYLPSTNFSYQIPMHADSRGVFVEMLKTQDSGQFSFFSSLSGVTRGEHYHHSKTEKFLVIKGHAKFNFRQILTNEKYSVEVDATESTVVETVPGWAHSITNMGDGEMLVMLWASEIFDHSRPDTFAAKV